MKSLALFLILCATACAEPWEQSHAPYKTEESAVYVLPGNVIPGPNCKIVRVIQITEKTPALAFDTVLKRARDFGANVVCCIRPLNLEDRAVVTATVVKCDDSKTITASGYPYRVY